MDVGPVELLVLTYPGERADLSMVSALAEAIERGYLTVLDLVCVSRRHDGEVRVVDVDDNLAEVGLDLQVSGQVLLSEEDLDVAREALAPGSSAAVIVYEHSWARRLAGAIGDAGGEVALHVRIPREAVHAALAAAGDLGS